MASTTTRRDDRRTGGLAFGPTAPPRRLHGGPISCPHSPTIPEGCPVRGAGDAIRDAQAGVPSARRPGAQLAFKDSMVHGILQFTPSIAFRYVLHRCESRDIRCRESFMRFGFLTNRTAPWGTATASRYSVVSSLARTAPVVVFRAGRPTLRGLGWGGADGPPTTFAPDLSMGQHVRGSLCCAGIDNDPSAGSPTETLLRLLLPLNDKVQWTSRDVAGGEPPTSPRSEHFTGPFNR